MTPERRPFLAANWKMHKTIAEAREYLDRLLSGEAEASGVVIGGAPPAPALAAAAEGVRGSGVRVAAQNAHFESQGAFTGELSPPMLTDLGAWGAVVGHSERREHFGDTDADVARKVRAVFEHDMTPIMCVGETAADRDAGRTEDKVVGQVREGVGKVGPEEASRLVVAYEPVWAIGTGRACNPTNAGEVVRTIRDTLETLFSTDVAESVRVQYGGSVKPGNIREFMAHPEIDGALVGGASLDPEDFALIVKH
jgi:triosephosphate isomerase (TIM)